MHGSEFIKRNVKTALKYVVHLVKIIVHYFSNSIVLFFKINVVRHKPYWCFRFAYHLFQGISDLDLQKQTSWDHIVILSDTNCPND